LSDDDLQVLQDYAEQLQEDSDANPKPAQEAVIEAYEERYEEFKSTGAPEINGWPIG
jgi:biotin-(acetyl-CoA carboxylase) ligase